MNTIATPSTAPSAARRLMGSAPTAQASAIVMVAGATDVCGAAARRRAIARIAPRRRTSAKTAPTEKSRSLPTTVGALAAKALVIHNRHGSLRTPHHRRRVHRDHRAEWLAARAATAATQGNRGLAPFDIRSLARTALVEAVHLEDHRAADLANGVPVYRAVCSDAFAGLAFAFDASKVAGSASLGANRSARDLAKALRAFAWLMASD